MGDESEWVKLPPEQKVECKPWKARVAGYEECTKLFKTLDDEKSPEFSRYLGLMKKFVCDSNAIAQEKALDAVLAYVEKAHVAGKTTGDVVGGVVTKCLNSSRTKTKEKGMEVIMMYIEIEKCEVVQDELLKGLGNKQPKIVAGCVQCLRIALRDFGSKVMTLKPIVKQLTRLLEDRDKVVREETKQLVVEIYRWIGAALKPALASLKPVQLSELEAEFEKISSSKPRQTRFLRSQQDLKAKMEEEAEGEDEADGEAGEDEAVADVDPYELLPAVDILSKLPKEFYEKIEAKKWQERKEMLDPVLKLAENPKLEPGEYGDLVRALKKVVAKDSNVILVTLAIKCIHGLAVGLRKKFSSYAPLCIETCLEKFKEKKVTVVQANREAVDALYICTTLDSISEACVASLEHKTPTVKAETASFMARCFSRCTITTLPKKLLKMFVTPLLKTANDTSGDVREASFTALGTAMKVVGEKHLAPYLADIDNLKLAKIKESCEKAVVIGKGGKAAGGSSAPAAKAEEGAKKVVGGKAPAKGKPLPKSESAASLESNASSKTGGHGSRPQTAPPKAGAGKLAAKKKGAKGKKDTEGKGEATENILADEAVEEKMANILPTESITGLVSSNWKERLAAVEKFTSVIQSLSKSEIPTQAIIRTLGKKPGLKENNFQVLKLKVDLISTLAKNSVFTKCSAEFCLQDLVDKVGDVKNGSSVQEALSCIAEATSLEYVSQQVVRMAFDQKNPKNQSEALNWLAKAVKEFGLKVNVKPMIQNIKKAFSATNPAVRGSAINVLSVLYMYMGATLRVFFEDEKPALLQQIDAEFDKVKGQKPAPPTRGLAPDEEGKEAEENDEEDEDGAEAINVADLVPRTDISELITEDIVDLMADKNWKVRNEALQKVTAILNNAKFITPNIGPLPEALKIRLGDSNKILVNATLTICQTIATATGPNVKQHVRVIGPGLVGCLGDSKPNVRTNAVNSLSNWVEQCGLQPFVEAEILSDSLKTENPFLRAELLGWLAEQLPKCRKLPPELGLCVAHLYSCLEDRNADVRKKAQEALMPFMIHVGYDSMFKKAGKLKASSKDQVVQHLEKARENLPQLPKKSAPASKQAVSKTEVKKQIEKEEEPERPSTAPATSGKTTAGANKGRGKTANANKKAAPVGRKKDEPEDTSPPLKATNGKDQRFKDERNRKVLKWNFTSPSGEFIEQLKQQMEATFNKTLMDQLFHSDFKNHIKGIDTILKSCETNAEAVVANLDLILKWMTLRFFDTNTSVMLKGLELLQAIFAMLSAEDYHLQEPEATSFIPYLILKVGDPKDNVRKNVRNIFKLVCQVYPASKMFSFLIEGLKSKNSKQRAECLEELGSLVEIYGINVCQPSPAQALKIIAQQIADRDNSVRSAALNTIVTAYSILGEAVYKYVGTLKDKDLGMLEERIKRSGKVKPPSAKASPEEKPKIARVPPNQQKTATQEVRPGGLRGRPIKPRQEFTLDMDDNETAPDEEMPQLVQHDLEDIMDEPIKLPETRLRPPSPSVKLINTSNDAKSAIDLVISQIASNDIITGIQALAQIDEVLKDEEKSDMLAAHVDQFLVVCSLQLRMTYTRHMSNEDSNKDDVVRLYRCIVASLMALFQCKDLAQTATKDVLKDLVYNLITILLDPRLTEMKEGPQIVRSVNVMVVKIVDKSDHTNAMSALIKLLHESVGSETCSGGFMELVMKCLWKMVRMLPNIINDLNLDRIIGDLNMFLKAFPTPSWKARKSDVPLRTIKTILHSLTKLKGNKIMNHLSMVEENSEVEAYLQKVLKHGSNSNNDSNVTTANTKNEQMNGVENVLGNTPKKDSNKSPNQLSKKTHDMLAEIFKKIGSKENTREGLNDLYDFKLTYPEADLEPFLKKSSPFFQNYIERGLKNIDMEREGKLRSYPAGQPTMSASSSAQSLSSVGSISSVEGDVNPQVFMDRLKVLRARCGLDNSHYDASKGVETPKPLSRDLSEQQAGSTSSLSSNSSGGGGGGGVTHLGSSTSKAASSSASESDASAPNVEDLKRRLQRIKNAAKN